MTVTIHQPQYLPWLGYLHKIRQADAFVSLDTVQFKKNEFQNRNRIKTAQGTQWLTVPVRHKHPQTIAEVEINNSANWRHKQLQALTTNYRKASGWEQIAPPLEELLDREWSSLSFLNLETIRILMKHLGIQTAIYNSADIAASDHPTQRLVDICSHLGADVYLSGAGGRSYLELTRFEEAEIRVEFQEFEHPVYPQLFGPFEPNLSAVDLLFNCGSRAAGILGGVR
jgi:hypothetical protein